MEPRSEADTRHDVSKYVQEETNHQSPPSYGESTTENEKRLLLHLTEDEQRILDRQLDTPVAKSSYFMLYRYATKVDLLIIAIAAICAIGAGAVFPLMTVRIPSSILFGPLY